MARSLRAVPEQSEPVAPLRIIGASFDVPRAYVPSRDSVVLECRLSRALNRWEQRVVQDRPDLTLTSEPGELEAEQTMGAFWEDYLLVRLNEVTAFDLVHWQELVAGVSAQARGLSNDAEVAVEHLVEDVGRLDARIQADESESRSER